ncbi:hypothetical protein EMPS_06330 [Entomortierella parvispora]|uniref:RNA-directed DNA polymerase n=1 Tax=Entomortierella parvispora TaxID=205924 RepID=A0A9P3LXC6_9FUNG|nr:hypothetical protein EMPS_06330 [Entomortierella parvispora]
MYELYLVRHNEETDDTDDESESSDDDDDKNPTAKDKQKKKDPLDDRGKSESKAVGSPSVKRDTKSFTSAKNNSTQKNLASKDDIEAVTQELDRLKILIKEVSVLVATRPTTRNPTSSLPYAKAPPPRGVPRPNAATQVLKRPPAMTTRVGPSAMSHVKALQHAAAKARSMDVDPPPRREMMTAVEIPIKPKESVPSSIEGPSAAENLARLERTIAAQDAIKATRGIERDGRDEMEADDSDGGLRRMMVPPKESRKVMETRKVNGGRDDGTSMRASSAKKITWEEKDQSRPPSPEKKKESSKNDKKGEQKKKKTDGPDLTLESDEAFLKSLPNPIVLQLKQKPFDIRQCLRTTKVEGLTIGQLMELSPSIRRTVQASLKTVPREERVLLTQEYPSLLLGESEIEELRVFLNRVERSKTDTHGFRAAIMGTKCEILLDGGSCVNVIRRGFLDQIGITNHTPYSSFSLKGLTGNAGVAGEAPGVPIDIQGIMIPAGCVIVDSVDFDILLGRPFLEACSGYTNWSTAITTLHVQGFKVTIDGRARTLPIVSRVDNQDDTSESEAELSEDTSEDSGTDNEASSTSEKEDGDEGYALLIRNIQEGRVERTTVEQLKQDDAKGDIVNCWFLQAVFPEPPIPDGRQPVSCLSVVDASHPSPSAEISSIFDASPIMVNDSYGFHLEAPRCRDRLTNTPVMLLPGLEERSVYVGDIPEVHDNLSEIRRIFQKHEECFPKEGEMSRTLNADMLEAPASFHLKPGSKFPRAYNKKYSPGQITTLCEYRDQMVKAGKMRRSSSPASCNPLLIQKKDNSYRVCVNFIPVNKLIAPMAWPLPDPITEIYKLQGCEFLSFWDCKDGYLQSPIAEDSRFLTAVAFPDGLYEYNVLPMGLIDSMQWYTRHMGEVFSTIKERLGNFVDDMATGDGTFHLHFRTVEEVLARMDMFNGSFSGKKSAFFVKQREFLGRIVGDSRISADPKKLFKMEYWPVPQNVTELRGFVGFALFLCDFISNFSAMAAPLFPLYKLHKDPNAFVEKWMSDPKYMKAFRDIQVALVTAPVLIMMDHKRPVIISADTSDFATGHVVAHCLNPEDDDRIDINVKYQPIVFGSRKLSGAESRYFATERELLGLVYCLVKHSHLLEGKEIHVFIDHRALLYMHNLSSRSARLTRWTLIIAQYRVTIHHRPGRDMKDSDPLSRIHHKNVTGEDLPDLGVEEAIEIQENKRLMSTLLISEDQEPFVSIVAALQGDPLTYLDKKFKGQNYEHATQVFLLLKVVYSSARLAACLANTCRLEKYLGC